MFGKKCPKCKRKSSKSYDFCPYCGNNFKSEYSNEDYGMLGKNDFIEKNDFNDFRGSFIDKLFKNAMKEIPSMMKMIERQMQNPAEKLHEIENNFERMPNNLNVQFFVNGKRIFPEQKETQKKFILKENKISKDNIEKLTKLPRIEPDSRIRRLSGKIIYELSIPGVKDKEDIIINQLENSTEIKAISKDKIYSKTLNINFPIINCRLEKENLILEFRAKN